MRIILFLLLCFIIFSGFDCATSSYYLSRYKIKCLNGEEQKKIYQEFSLEHFKFKKEDRSILYKNNVHDKYSIIRSFDKKYFDKDLAGKRIGVPVYLNYNSHSCEIEFLTPFLSTAGKETITKTSKEINQPYYYSEYLNLIINEQSPKLIEEKFFNSIKDLKKFSNAKNIRHEKSN